MGGVDVYSFTCILRMDEQEHQREPSIKGEHMNPWETRTNPKMTSRREKHSVRLWGKASLFFISLCFCTSGCTATSTSSIHPETVTAPEVLPSPSERCETDGALLSLYPIDTLYGTPLPSECCAPGVLSEGREWLCEHDWPSSDVPPCSVWQELAKELHAFRSSPPDWVHGKHEKTGQRNMLILMQWADARYQCIPEEDPS